ncbi:TetR family transcriptional regulator [Nocardioides sp. TRM66260-LWL]|uniref:TetR/AcrR family transcriptional regulator n=1 Tax=Nocardioides sp. TRM66260-LWL TaxID=2874478 RepID=UPI001CC68D2B|nr:TetR family transcriptional regulator [Nocardioides sp. TRM66260-LWL]MBZ5735490.1 TetR family transcriptional regulator [Nocardioides sp. TRM66260-LWL]
MSTRQASTRERIVDAGVALTTEVGWSGVTMARLAEVVGVSRQTVYNEVGTKAGLAEAMILAELERFMGVVDAAFDRHSGDLVAAIRASAHDVLVHASDNPLLHAVVSATHGADTELLPLLTTHAQSLLETAKQVIAARVAPYQLSLAPAQVEAMIDMVVRVVLSHVMAPSAAPDDTAESVSFVAAKVLDLD